MKTFEFTEDACKLLEQCIRHRIDYLHSTNEVFVRMVENEFCDKEISALAKNIATIGKLKTLLNYINS